MNYPNLNNIEKDVFIVFLKILKQINKKKLLTEKNELFLQIQSKLEKNNEFQTVLILFGKFEIYYFICSLQKKIKSEQSHYIIHSAISNILKSSGRFVNLYHKKIKKS